MGFYGNITNTARTQFQFDLVYPNRYQMELKTYTDNVYAGRYVLIEYDKEPIVDNTVMTEFYPSVSGNHIIGSLTKGGTPIKIGYNGTAPQIGDLFYTVEVKEIAPGAGTKTTTAIYVVDSGNPGQNAHFRMATDSDDNYVKNYNIDVAHYGPGRGYDSTVWQKVYSEGQEKYVMVAELNTVVPTFDVAADAPTMNPIIPHFDANSTDVYYKLHWQAPWGFRIKEDNTHSDERTVHTTYLYDAENNTHTKSEKTVNAAIYYNKPAFNAQVGVSPAQIKKHSNATDKINLNLAASGNLYNKHDGSTDMSVQNDIQELTISLPSIGNMMSDAWDIIHGPNRNDDMRQVDENGNYVGSLQGRLDSIDAITANTIPVKVDPDGKLVGTKINGDSRRVVAAEGILNEELSTSFNQDDAWIYTKVDSSNTPNGIAIHHTFHAKADTTSTSNINGNGDTIQLYTPKVDAAGHVVGKNTETVTLPFGFKTIKTNGRSTAETENATGTPTTTNIVADKTQDDLTINSGNKWIRIDSNASADSLTISHDIHNTSSTTSEQTLSSETAVTTFDVPTYSFDKAGHYTSHDTKTITMPCGYGKISGDSGNTAATATFDEVTFTSDEWLTATVSKDTVTYSHDYPKKEANTTSSSNMNDSNSDAIVLETLKRDDKGHVVAVNQHTVTLPYGYKTFTGDTGSTNANSTQDSASITGDNWISSIVSNDAISITHKDPVVGTATAKDNITPNFGDTFTVEDHYFDTKGHKFETKTHTVKIPQPSLTPGEGNVVTGLALTPVTGAMTETKALLGAITLGTYENSDNSDDLAADISLQNALRRLQNKNANTNKALTDEADARKAADEGLQKNIDAANTRINSLIGGESLNEAFNTLQKVSDWMSTNDTDADKVIDDIAILNGDDTVEGSVKKQLKDSIEALDVEDTAVEGQYVSAVNEVNGKVVITRADLPVLGSAAYEDVENFASATILEDVQFPYAVDEMDAAFTRMTIAELFTVVAQLSNQVALLQEEVNTLKAHHEPVIDEGDTPVEEKTPTEP